MNALSAFSSGWICQQLFAGEFANSKLFERGCIDSGMILIGNHDNSPVGCKFASLNCSGQTCNAIADNYDFSAINIIYFDLSRHSTTHSIDMLSS